MNDKTGWVDWSKEPEDGPTIRKQTEVVRCPGCGHSEIYPKGTVPQPLTLCESCRSAAIVDEIIRTNDGADFASVIERGKAKIDETARLTQQTVRTNEGTDAIVALAAARRAMMTPANPQSLAATQADSHARAEVAALFERIKALEVSTDAAVKELTARLNRQAEVIKRLRAAMRESRIVEETPPPPSSSDDEWVNDNICLMCRKDKGPFRESRLTCKPCGSKYQAGIKTGTKRPIISNCGKCGTAKAGNTQLTCKSCRDKFNRFKEEKGWTK